MKKHLFVIAMIQAFSANAWPTISNVEVLPLSPWGGVVSYLVEGELPNYSNSYSAWVVISNITTAASVEANIMKGDRSLTLGEHQLWWNGPSLKLGDYSARIKYEPLCSRGLGTHVYSIKSSSQATCLYQGHVTRKCSLCGHEYTTYTSALGHNWEYLGAYKSGRWYQCSRCGQQKKEEGY